MKMNEISFEIESALKHDILLNLRCGMHQQKVDMRIRLLLLPEEGGDGYYVRMTAMTPDGKPLHGLMLKSPTSRGTKERSLVIEY